MDLDLRDDTENKQFELLVDGERAGLAAYRVRDGITVITHSEVDPAMRGKGLGGELARRTLDHLRSTGARVIPSCPFFAKYVAEHPSYNDILAT